MILESPPVLGGAALPPELIALTHGAAAELATRGVGMGARVAVDSTDVLPWLLGADLLGAATLVVEPSWTPRERAAVLADAVPDVVITGAPQPGRRAGTPAGDAGTAFYLPTTSGSGGSPKVLVRTRDSWLRSFAAMPLPGTGPALIPGALSSSLFLFGALHALHSGRRPLLRRRRWTEACAAAEIVHLVPAMLAVLLDALAADPALRAASRLRAVVCGGAHLDDGLRRRLGTLLPGCELIEYYGSAEHSLIAVRDGDAGLRPVDGVDVAIRDGRVWVRSPLAAAGRLVAGAVRVAPEWSTVEDMGTLHADGTLTVHGRAGATVSSGGRIVAAEEVETALRGVPGVVDVVVTGSPHSRLGAIVTAVVEIDTAAPPTLRELRRSARTTLEPGKLPRRWIATTALPRTASGKPARAAVIEQLREGSLPAWTLR